MKAKYRELVGNMIRNVGELFSGNIWRLGDWIEITSEMGDGSPTHFVAPDVVVPDNHPAISAYNHHTNEDFTSLLKDM